MRKRLIAKSLAGLLQASLLFGVATPASAAPVFFDYTGGLQSYTVTTSGLYDIVAWGAQGGTNDIYAGGLGAQIGGYFNLLTGDMVYVAVGGMGKSGGGLSGSGGGGSFVVLGNRVTKTLVVAGGGGGAGFDTNQGAGAGQAGTAGASGGSDFSTTSIGAGGTDGSGGAAASVRYSGGGGGGLLSDGGTGNMDAGGGGLSLIHGLAGGAAGYYGSAGGYGGGGGSARDGAGGGGGYSGGGAGDHGGGGGSYNGGLTSQDLVLLSGVNAGNGRVSLELIPEAAAPNAVPEPMSLALVFPGLVAVVVTRRRKALQGGSRA